MFSNNLFNTLKEFSTRRNLIARKDTFSIMETTDQASIKPMTAIGLKRKRLISVAAVLLFAAAGGYYWFSGQEQEAQDQPLL